MKAIIIDDEPIARQGIRLLADQIPYLSIETEFGNPLIAQEYIVTHKELDLIFLDVEMPGITGVNYLRSMPPKCQVILTTAYPQYALEAFELDVIDYLLKPIRIERFAKAVHKVKELLALQSYELEVQDKDSCIYIRSDRKYIKLTLEEIVFIKGLKDYVIIHTLDGKYLTAMNVGTIARQLDDDIFARVSKSYIINVNFIQSIDQEIINCVDQEIPLGKAYKEEFLKKYINKSLLKR